MLRYMLDTNICICVIRNRPETLRHRFNRLAEQLCISAVTLDELMYGAEKSARPAENLAVVDQFAVIWKCCRLAVGRLRISPSCARRRRRPADLLAHMI